MIGNFSRRYLAYGMTTAFKNDIKIVQTNNNYMILAIYLLVCFYLFPSPPTAMVTMLLYQ